MVKCSLTELQEREFQQGSLSPAAQGLRTSAHRLLSVQCPASVIGTDSG